MAPGRVPEEGWERPLGLRAGELVARLPVPRIIAPVPGLALNPGTRIGSYEIVAQLGAGGMGEVYRATDTNLKRQVAIKVLPESLAASRTFTAWSEARARMRW